MSKKKIIATVYCLLLLLVSCSKKANNDVDNQTSKPTDPVCLTIEADKSLYKKEEDILLSVGFGIMEEDSESKTLNISVASGEFHVEGESSMDYELSDNNYVATLDSEGFYESAEFVTFALSGVDSTITFGEIRVSLYTYGANGDQQYFMSKALYYASDKSNIVININSVEDAIDELP